jgi:carboxyl-terminal processing protease
MRAFFSFRFALVSFALMMLTNPAYAVDAKAEAKKEKEETASTYELLNLFGEVFDRVRSDYVEPVSDQKLIESALNGMLVSLDPHSSYMNEKSFNDMKITTKGEFGGLGIEVTMENGLVKVVSPIDDTPAAKAGIKPGDYISMIDETPVMGLSLSEAVDKMRGVVGAPIKITVLREGAKEPMVMNLKRELIKIQAVRSRVEGDVVYLRVTSFSENVGDIMTAAYEKEKKTLGGNARGVVLDLRNNPGGLLDQAIAVSDAFLEQGEVVSTRSRNPNDSRRFNATSGDIANGLPMVVLINEGSASASEIVAGALKDHKRAVVLGMKSFGKGSVQTVIPIDHHGAIRLTTARYYTPSGTSIQATGIVPDIQVKQAKIEALASNMTISESILRGHLINEQEKSEHNAEHELDTEKTVEKPRLSAPTKLPIGKDLPTDQDYQLSRALDLVRALSIYQKTAVPAKSGKMPTPVKK